MNKIALGYHRMDVMGTFMMNIFFKSIWIHVCALIITNRRLKFNKALIIGSKGLDERFCQGSGMPYYSL